MHNRTRLIAGAAAVAALAGGGAAIAANQGSFQDEQNAVLAAAAQQLGVEPAELSAALTDALSARIDAAVAAGTLTEEDGARMKERLADGDVPLVGLPGMGPHVHGIGPLGGLEAAAGYLGLTRAQLREALADGDTLADVAKENGKSVDGLEAAMLAAAKDDLAAAVARGRVTEAQQTEILADLPDRIADLVAGTFQHGFGPRPGGPPVFGPPPSG
ncbi:MAG TPA: hypothetical protein VJ689_12180, partial [Gaiellaceae bacterium]|nr:hypothetical protein [Gaiellaceae bacterium]